MVGLSKSGRRFGAFLCVLGLAATMAPTWWRLAAGPSAGKRLRSAVLSGQARVAEAGLALRQVREPDEASLSYLGRDGERITPDRIRAFLDRQDSPMSAYAKQIVAAGMKHGVDPRVLVAIAGVESSYGVYARGHNAWGWRGGRWRSWPQAIESFTQALASRYGSLRTGRFALASSRYCPPCGPRWGVKALSIFVRI